MSESASRAERPKRRFPWIRRVGWLLVLAPVILALLSLTGSMSERKMVELSVFPIAVIGFGLGLLVSSRWVGPNEGLVRAVSGCCVTALLGSAAALFLRWFFFENVFDRF